MDSKFMQILGWAATCATITMFVSYIPQISRNMSGDKGDWLQPLVAAINSCLWVTYGLSKKPKRDWPIVVANSPGIFFGIFTCLTAL